METRTAEETAVTITQPTPMAMVQLALQQNAGIETIEKLMALQERWQANDARKAFVEAMAAFKANPPRLEKNKTVSFPTSKGKTEYKHATLDYVAEVLGRELSKHGLSFRWQTAQEGGKIRVTCFLQHILGHGESVTLEAPADDSGQKNAIQQIGSTVTYLQRYTLLAATGMATADQDMDGILTNGELMEQIEWIGNASDMDELRRLYNNAAKPAFDAGNKTALMALAEARDKRAKELQ